MEERGSAYLEGINRKDVVIEMLFRKYETILIDADDTLLDYPSAESGALREMLKEYGIFWKESMAEQFKNICNEEWSRCRLDNVTERSVLKQYHKRYYEYSVKRFARVKQWLSLEETAEVLSERYLDCFSRETTATPKALEVCKKLSRSTELYAATNGLTRLQTKRLVHFQPYLKGMIISESAGACKPMKEFFETCLKSAGISDVKKALMVGDSLSTDILGAKTVGMDSCYYNRYGKENRTGITPTYEIRSLEELLG